MLRTTYLIVPVENGGVMLSAFTHVTCLLLVANASPMKLKSVTLYKNGIGYFERQATATLNQELEILLGPGQLSDAVKSLVVLGNRSIASVDYLPPTSVKAEQARLGRSGAGESEDDASVRVGALPELANQLRGEEVEVRLKKGNMVLGKIVEVSTKILKMEGQENEARSAKEVATLMLSGPTVKSQMELLSKVGAKNQVETLAQKLVALEAASPELQKDVSKAMAELSTSQSELKL